MNFYKLMNDMDSFIETDLWFYIEIGIMVTVVLTAVIVYFIRKFREAREE